LVYRVKTGGIGLIAGLQSGAPSPELLFPGSKTTAAAKGEKNYPAIAVDEQARAHVAWAPPSAPQNGVYYARVSPSGNLLGSVAKASDKWVEYLSIQVREQRVHLLTTAIRSVTEPESADGVFHLQAACDGGAFSETEAWFAPIFFELYATESPTGLAVIGRDTNVRRIDWLAANKQWKPRTTHAIPSAADSIGRPAIAFDGAQPLWATIGWSKSPNWHPSGVWVTEGNDQAWQALAKDDVFAPGEPDGTATAAVTVNGGVRAVDWLSANAPRLRLAIATHAWGKPSALSGTEKATSFALTPEGNALRIVFATEDGTLHSGLAGSASPAPEPSTSSATASSGAGGGANGGEGGQAAAQSGAGGASVTPIVLDSPASCSVACDSDSPRAVWWLAIAAALMTRRARSRR
jgi:hypothetical protein